VPHYCVDGVLLVGNGVPTVIGVARNGYRGDGSGYGWPGALSGTGTIGDIMGFRTFSAHSSGIDFHRGCDDVIGQGATVYSPMSGAIIRQHYTFFGWQTSSQMDRWSISNTNSSLAVSHNGTNLVLTCSRVGSASFPSGVDRYYPIKERIYPHGTGDWLIQIGLTSTISTTGAIGIGVFNDALTEYIGMEYDGATITRRGVGTTTFTANGATTSIANQTWLRITYAQSTGGYAWLYSTDGSTWTTIGTETGRTFTSALATHSPTIYWRSGDTNATPYSIGVQKLEFYDLAQNTASRFGNHMYISNGTEKFALLHFESFSAYQGQHVQCRQVIGRAGKTGFDTTSGAVLAPHVHIERSTTTPNYTYAGDDSINPLAPGLLPRTNVSNNVAVVRTRENDPEGNDSHLLTITTTRADQDFDLNSVSLTGNLATRTVNYNTRGGVDPANQDNNIYQGVRFVCQSFDSTSPTNVLKFYFRTATVGTTFTSYTVLDTAGTTLASG
jgi:hypothetical protein